MANNYNRHRKPSVGSKLVAYVITVICVAIALAGLLAVAVLAAKGLWWALTC